MTAIVVGQVGDTTVGVTSDGKVWALGRSWTPDETDELVVHMTKAARLARLGDETESPTDMGKFI